MNEESLAEGAEEVAESGRKSQELRLLSSQWISAANSVRYSYHFAALDRPNIQYPKEILEPHPGFEIDESIDNKLLSSVAPCGFLRRKM